MLYSSKVQDEPKLTSFMVIFIITCLLTSCSLFEHPVEVDLDEHQKELLREVRERGEIRVWVTYDREFTPVADLDEEQLEEEERAIAEMHKQFMQVIQKNNLNVRAINKMRYSPKAAMFVDEEALMFFFNSPLVKEISMVIYMSPS